MATLSGPGSQDEKPAVDDAAAGVGRVRPGLAEKLAGEAKQLEDTDYVPQLPMELVGGSVPQIPGTEDEAVWNAAAQACGTEKVHYCYTVEERRCWFLAVPSQAMASSPNSWCPLAAALPGNSEHWDRETVYLYEQEGLASALRWDPETGRMQVYLGPARTILPRIQSMDANFVSINPEMADIIPWKSRSLRRELLGRAVSKSLFLSGLLVAIGALLVVFYAYVHINLTMPNLDEISLKTDQAVDQLMMSASSSLQSDSIDHMVRVQELLESLSKVNGTLVKYSVKGGKVEWEALVPQAIGNANIRGLQGQVVGELAQDGRVRVRGTR